MKALIVEDEVRSQRLLGNLLALCNDEIEVVGVTGSVTEAVSLIESLNPDIIFLDIQLSDGVGFEVLERCGPISAHLVFTTAFDQYAIKAFELSAVDYLIKPIDIDHVKRAVLKCHERNHLSISKKQVEGLLQNLSRKRTEDPILSISTAENIEFVKVREIIRCEANGAYTKLFLNDGRKVMISKVIKDLENLLSEYQFFRIHQSHLINISHIRKYWKKNNQLEMIDDSMIPIARTRKERFLATVGNLKI